MKVKVKVKATGKIVEADKLVGYDTLGKYYSADEVEEISSDEIDWQAYRREVAKECITNLCGDNRLSYGWSKTEGVALSIQIADALVECLKNTEEQ